MNKAYFDLLGKVTAIFRRNIILGMAAYLVWAGVSSSIMYGLEVGAIAFVRYTVLLVIRFQSSSRFIKELKIMNWMLVGLSSGIIIFYLPVGWPLPWPDWVVWPFWLKLIVFTIIEPPLFNWGIYCTLHPEHAEKTKKHFAKVSARITKKK